MGRLLSRPEVRLTRRLLAAQYRWASGSRSQHSGVGREPSTLDVLKNSRQGAVQFVHESESLMEAIRTMIDNEVGSLVVQDSSERVVGFLTGRDMLRTVGTCADAYAPGPPWGTCRLRVPASRVLYVPVAQGGLPPAPHVLYCCVTRTSHGRTVRAMYRDYHPRW